jgi:phage gp46-like protein
MPDIRLVQRGEFPYRTSVSVDWLLLSDGTLDQTEALATAVIVALGTDRLADDGDVLPDPDSSDRRGWWGDLEANEIWGAWPIGCRLWLLRRAKITGPQAWQGSLLTIIEHYIAEAIQPFVDQKTCSDFQIVVQRVDKQRIDALITLFRGPLTEIELQFQVLWDGIIE